MKRIDTRTLQMMKLDALKVVDEICKKENIRYFLGYGTLIGAVREHGFVPWDEDIDLYMLREDMDRFDFVASKYLDEKKYFLQNYGTEQYLTAPLTRICINGTYRCASGMEKANYDKGTFIDIFPLDSMSSEEAEEKYNKVRKLFNKFSYSIAEPLSKQAWKRAIKRFIRVFYRLTSADSYHKQIHAIATSGDKTSDLLVSFAGPYGIKRESYKKEWFKETVYFQFEDEQFPCPSGYHELLTNIYGDYMVRPKEGDRKIDAPTYYAE